MRSGAGLRSVQAGQRQGPTAAGQADALLDLGDRADAREGALMLGNEQDLVLVAGVDGEGHVHVGEDDGVLERDETKAVQGTVSIADYEL